MKQWRGFSSKLTRSFEGVGDRIDGSFLISKDLKEHLRHPDLGLSLIDQIHILNEVELLKKQIHKCKKGKLYLDYVYVRIRELCP